MLRRTLILTAGSLALATAARPSFAATPLIDEIKARGTLRAGLSTFVPWAMRDKTGKLIGYELDVGTRLAADLGVKYEPMPTAWDGIIPALLAGNFDLIIGGMTVTPAREQSVDFTEPYSFTGIAMVASKKVAPGLNTLEAFNKPSMTLVARRGTPAATVVQEKLPLATLRQFDDDAPALQELLNGNAAAWFTSTPKPAFAAIDHADALYLPLEKPITPQRDAMAIRKGEPATIEVLNKWIAARKADGFLAERFHYWFEQRTWLSQVQS
jgi:polar amino acid transport system substrate-binding protein